MEPLDTDEIVYMTAAAMITALVMLLAFVTMH